MKKLLIVGGVAAMLAGSRKEVKVMPCSNNIKVTYFSNGKKVFGYINKTGNSYISNLHDTINNFGKKYIADSITFEVAPYIK